MPEDSRARSRMEQGTRLSIHAYEKLPTKGFAAQCGVLTVRFAPSRLLRISLGISLLICSGIDGRRLLQIVAPDVIGHTLRHVAASGARVAPVNTAIGPRDHHLILEGGEGGVGAGRRGGVGERDGAES